MNFYPKLKCSKIKKRKQEKKTNQCRWGGWRLIICMLKAVKISAGVLGSVPLCFGHLDQQWSNKAGAVSCCQVLVLVQDQCCCCWSSRSLVVQNREPLTWEFGVHGPIWVTKGSWLPCLKLENKEASSFHNPNSQKKMSLGYKVLIFKLKSFFWKDFWKSIFYDKSYSCSWRYKAIILWREKRSVFKIYF